MTTDNSATERLRQVIEEQIRETDGLIDGLEAVTQPIEPDNAVGRLSRMEAITAKGISDEALRMAREKRIKLDDALKRVGEPGFGLCARCGEPIALERLLLLPESRLCVPCKSKPSR